VNSERERILEEIRRCDAVPAGDPDAFGATLGSCDWRAELALLDAELANDSHEKCV
jgi:hypothetical protein